MPPVRLELERAGHTPTDVSASHVPVSMRPLVLGVRVDEAHRDAGMQRCTLAVRDPALVRWWRYALAWRHAARAPARGDGLCMSAADLRCLNVYYTWPRRELTVRAVHRIGWHVLFVCRGDAERETTPRQIAHVSEMYAEWLVRRGRAVERLGG